MARFPPYFLPQSYLLLWLFYVLALGMSNLHKPVITSWYGALTYWSGLALAMLERSCFEGDIYLWETILVFMIAESVLLVTRELSLPMQIHRAWPSTIISQILQSCPVFSYEALLVCTWSWRPLLDDYLSCSVRFFKLAGCGTGMGNLEIACFGPVVPRNLPSNLWSESIDDFEAESQVFGLDMHLHIRSSAIDSARCFLRSCCLLVSFRDHTEACQTCGLEAVSTWRLEASKPPIWSGRASSSSATDSTWRFFQKLSSSSMMLRVFENGLGSYHTWTWLVRFLLRIMSLSTTRSSNNCSTLPFHLASILHLRLSISHAVSEKHVLLDFEICQSSISWMAWIFWTVNRPSVSVNHVVIEVWVLALLERIARGLKLA